MLLVMTLLALRHGQWLPDFSEEHVLILNTLDLRKEFRTVDLLRWKNCVLRNATYERASCVIDRTQGVGRELLLGFR
jgi:hypothetical protein